jgi:orotidine-5'-phosphate decarboxylase
MGITDSPADQVARLTDLAREAGIDGIVCSGEEVQAARAAWPEGFFVVPGVRPAGTDLADQKRVVTPRQAIDDGASVLVIGRPITAANNPAQAIREIAASLNEEART